MQGGFSDGNLFETNMALQCEVKSLRRTIEEFKSGKRYLKIQDDSRRVAKGYQKEIQKLRKELAAAKAETTHVRTIWTDECEQLWQTQLEEIGRKDEKIRKLEDRNWEIQRNYEEKISDLTFSFQEQIREKDSIIEALKDKLAHAEALLGRDSTNTSRPTGQTPPGKKKHIPNSRRSSGKKKGGQPGHKKHVLEKPPIEEVTEVIEHSLENGARCPACGSGDLVWTGRYEERYEIDVKILVEKKLHKFREYQCNACGEIVRIEAGQALQAECQYGPTVQAVALSLMNTTNAAINKVPLFLSGITEGGLCPSEGYVSKLMKRAAGKLGPFIQALIKILISRPTVYWDDSTAMAGARRICIRFYGDERTAYYVAHDKKDMDSVIEDGILDMLTENTAVMHDHNSINYNERFSFQNIECNAHLQRDLQKITDDTGHKKPGELKELISAAIKDRNDLIRTGETGFDASYIERFDRKLEKILKEAQEEAEKNTSIYSGPFERAVIKRVYKYRDNYFSWVRDFTIPTTNNLSERALRGIKTKMKVSGQFSSTQNANNYAMIRTYIETCRRNGINEITALRRLCEDNPYTVEEIFSSK